MCDYRVVEIERGVGGGFGFSVIGGIDTELPPMVCALVHNGSAQLCGKVNVGDVLIEVNGECVSRFPAKKVVETLRESPDTIHLRLRRDPEVEARALPFLRRFSVQDPKLQQFQTKVRRSASLPYRARRPPLRTRSQLMTQTDPSVTTSDDMQSRGKIRTAGEISPLGIDSGADGTFRRRLSKRNDSFSRIMTSFPADTGPPCTVANSKRTPNRNPLRAGGSESEMALKRTTSDNTTKQRKGHSHSSSLPEIAVSRLKTAKDSSLESWCRSGSSGDSLVCSASSRDNESASNNNHVRKTGSDNAILSTEPNRTLDLTSSPYQFRRSRNSLASSSSPNSHAATTPERLSSEKSPKDETRGGSDVETNARAENGTSEHSRNETARRLFYLEGYQRKDISPMLCKNNDFSKAVAVQFMKYFDFEHDTLLDSLRKLLEKFNLTGETQERERILIPFSNRYYECNKPEYGTADAVHTLICSIMLLNTDLHGEQTMGRRMKQMEFFKNLSDLCDGKDFPVELLKSIYTSIKSKPLVLHSNDSPLESPSEKVKANGKGSEYRTVDDDIVYKEGLLYRKLIEEAGGKKTSVWKRGWQPFFATLRGMIMFLHKPDESRRFDDTRFSLGVHHSFSSPALDYRKKPAVFRFITADWKVMLFQARDKTDMLEWVEGLNLVAAKFSAPPLPAPVGSSKKFQKPVLPFSRTRLTVTQQLERHENKAQEMENVLIEHLQKQPLPSSYTSQREMDEWMEKRDFFEYEYKRYRSYANILQSSKLQAQVRLRTDKTPTSRSTKRNGLLSDTMRRYSSLNDILDAVDEVQKSNTNYRESYFMAIYKKDDMASSHPN